MKPEHILFEAVVGSQAYGLATEASDIDRLGVYLEPTSKLVGIDAPARHSVTKVGKDAQGDWCCHELGKAISLWLQCNPTVTELLWLPPIETTWGPRAELVYMAPGDYGGLTHHVASQLRHQRRKFLSTKAVLNAYGGYARQQVKKLMRRDDGSFSSSTKNRTAKHARHCMRLLLQGEELLLDGKLTVDCSEHREWLFDMGELATKNIEGFVSAWTIRDNLFKLASYKSVLPDKPDPDCRAAQDPTRVQPGGRRQDRQATHRQLPAAPVLQHTGGGGARAQDGHLNREVVTRTDGWYVNLQEHPEFGTHNWQWYLYEPNSRAPRDAGRAVSREDALGQAGDARKRLRGLPVDVPAVKLAADAKDTSKKAAERVLPKTGTQRHAVLDFIQGSDMYGATDAEISFHLNIPENSVRPRRLELVEMGWIADSGLRRAVPGHEQAIVWVDAIHVSKDGMNVA